jgi:ribosomal protein L11 methyltransferase
MDPGMAFGSGTHPTTQVSLTLLEGTLIQSPAEKMIDLGCGSGILAIGAVKLGVKKILGVDTDPDAVRISFENAQANEISDLVAFREGSVKDILDQDEWSRGVPLVAANIIAPVLVALFEEGMGELVSPDGKIVLSGILKDQLPKILVLLEQGGFKLLEEIHQEGWVGLVAEKRSVR